MSISTGKQRHFWCNWCVHVQIIQCSWTRVQVHLLATYAQGQDKHVQKDLNKVCVCLSNGHYWHCVQLKQSLILFYYFYCLVLSSVVHYTCIAFTQKYINPFHFNMHSLSITLALFQFLKSPTVTTRNITLPNCIICYVLVVLYLISLGDF